MIRRSRDYPPSATPTEFKRWAARILAFLVVLPLATATAAPVRDKHVEVELIAEDAAVAPGRPFWVAVKLAMDEHWHTYWKNPGDSGLGTKIAWELPEGFAAGPIVWPHPMRIVMEPLVSYGYEHEVLLLTQIAPPATLDARDVTLRASVDWLMCKEACIPGKAKVSLTLPVAPASAPDARWTAAFAQARAAVPAAADGWTFRAEYDADAIELSIAPPDGVAVPPDAYFFPDSEELIEHGLPQAVRRVDHTLAVRMKRSSLSEELPDRLLGALVPGGPHRALAVDVTLQRAPGGTLAAPAAEAQTGGRRMTVPLALALAFVGGLILNLMPCVFPIISLKVLGFVKQAGESRARLLEHGLVFAAGVLVCFWILAGALLALRAGGAEIGWGFQLQSPRVIVVLASLFFLLGLSLFGVFEIGLSLTGAGGFLQARGGLAGTFFSGLLATIVATPCTAPFMGAALGFALAQPAAVSMLVFTALGLGMALPYIVLAASPGLIRHIPRPGPWMESMKQFMGFLMMAAVVWLVWVLSLQAGAGALVALAGAFVVLGFAAWIAGRWGALHRAFATRIAARVIAAVLIGAGVAAALDAARAQDGGDRGPATTRGGITWETYSADRVAELRAEGRPVFIDFTAAWCLTCQVNKRVALYDDDVEARFKDLGVATLRADWTDRDETIARALASYGRSGVPLYVLYGRDPDRPPALLPELLTPRTVLDALDELR